MRELTPKTHQQIPLEKYNVSIGKTCIFKVCGKNARGKIAIGKNGRGKIAIGKNVRAKVVKIP